MPEDQPGADLIEAGDADAVGLVVEVLGSGGAVVLPTDTVYGVAALPTVAGATDRLFALKDRSARQPLAVLVADVAQALTLVEPPSPQVLDWMERFWPGPLTLVMRRCADAAPLALGGDAATIGLRCPAHDLVRAVAAAVGPVATTSANRHGEPTATSAAEAAASLAAAVDLVVDGGPAGEIASTVVDVSSPDGAWSVLREGALPVDRLR